MGVLKLENGSFVTLIGLDFGLFWAAKDVVLHARAYLFIRFDEERKMEGKLQLELSAVG